MARQRTAAVLKILNGSAERNSARMRDDSKVRANGVPIRCANIELDELEQWYFDWYMGCGLLPAVHAREDSPQLHLLAKLCAQRDRMHALVKEKGSWIPHPISQRPMSAPWFTSLMQTCQRVDRMLNELALSPAGRLRHAPPLGPGGKSTEATSWDDIDD